MRGLLFLVVLLLLAFAGYEYVYKGREPPRSTEQAASQLREAAGDASAKAKEAVQAAAKAAGPAAQQAGEAIRQGAEELKAGAKALGDKAQAAAADARKDKTDPRAPVVDGVDLGTRTREVLGRARAALAGTTTASTAEAQLPTLADVDSALDSVGARLSELSADARRAFAGVAADSLPAMREVAERIKNINGVDPKVGAALDSMIARLDSWSRAPG